MTQETPTDYGALTGLVQAAGILISAALALGLTWRRRARWEPSEQDIPKGAERVGGLVTAVLTAVLWTQMKDQASMASLTELAMWGTAVTVVALLMYGYLVRVYTYEIDESTATATKRRKIIGCFTLTPRAKNLTKEHTIQEILEGAAYDPDKVWTRESKALAGQSFVASYLVLTVAGTSALTAASMIFLLSQQR